MRILILAYDFPPNGSIGGQRPYSWFKYFKQFGIHPVVVTRHWETVFTPDDTIRPCGTKVTVTETDEGTLIRVPFRPNLRDRMLLKFGNRFAVVRKILSLWFSLAQYHIPWADNRRNMLHAAREYLQEHPCDAVIATGEPFILFRYAQLLAEEFRIPWIADYRDGWSTDYSLLSSTSRMDHLVNRLFNLPVERSIVRTASLITTAAPAFKEELLGVHTGAKVEVVYNGFFEELFPSRDRRAGRNSSKFIIAYSGTVYPFQKAEIFLDGLRILLERNSSLPDELQVHFIGLGFQPDQSARIINRHASLLPLLKISERVPQQTVIGLLQQADLLLMLTNKDFKQIYAKVFEYIAVQSPVLVCENDHGPIEEILTESGTGLFADTPETVATIIEELMRKQAPFKPSYDRVSRFSRRNQALNLSQLIKELAPRP